MRLSLAFSSYTSVTHHQAHCPLAIMHVVLYDPTAKLLIMPNVKLPSLTPLVHSRGVSRRSQTGRSSETLILAPWSKVEEWRPQPPRQFGASEVFSAPPPRCPCLRFNGALFVMLFLFFTFLSIFFLSFSFPFLSFFFFYWRPFSDPGSRGPQCSPQNTPLVNHMKLS